MLRETLQRHRPGERGFTWRGHEVSRLEGFVDAVFGFAVTLLVATLDVPKTYPELISAMRGLIPFAVCFALLFWVWHQHYRFFRRYGLQDNVTHWLSGLLAFVVLLYVYPLRFMATLMIGELMKLVDPVTLGVVSAQQASSLMVIYSSGFAAVFLVFALLYGHAYRQAEALELSRTERILTRESIAFSLGLSSIGLVSVAIAALGRGRWITVAGLLYFAIGPMMSLVGMHYGKQIRAIEAGEGESPAPTA